MGFAEAAALLWAAVCARGVSPGYWFEAVLATAVADYGR